MSKYNVGDKFVIEIDEVFRNDADDIIHEEELYRIRGFKSLVFDDCGLDKLHQAITPAEDGLVDMSKVTEAYNKGLEDAWKLANKISDIYSASERARIFNYVVGGITVMDILRNFTPQEALAKLEAYEKEQEKARQKIMVGDIVTLEDGIKGVVMDEDGVDNVVIFTENGCIEAWMNKKYITKTGKHIDIQSLLEQIKE